MTMAQFCMHKDAAGHGLSTILWMTGHTKNEEFVCPWSFHTSNAELLIGFNASKPSLLPT